MAYPPAYNRAYSFTDFETLNPGVPKPGDKLDTEYDAVSNALTGTQTALALIQRADGALANESVGVDQLQAGLFDGIGDAATADAEAAAAAASASAAAAATSAAAAAASETSAATDAGVAAGSAAQAGVSQGIAQDAANEAALSAADADNSADVSVQAANDTAGSVAACEAHVERAFEWAELLTGPVLPAPPGWPEAVDDGMFSSKWWAIRARDFNSVTTIDLGTAGADIGEAFDIWDAVPGNDLGVGLTYATWGTPVQTYVLVDRGNPSDPTSWVNITGGPGPAGPPNTLTIGTVTTGAVGQPAAATITGAAPDQVLNLTLPTGATGPAGVAGPAGPPNALSIGTVTTVPDGTPSAANITGTAPTQVLNLTLTAGPQGIQGIQGIQGPVGPAVNVANPTGVIGLVAVNGVATTAPRSDSSPALSQAIAPTWTAEHKFSGTLTGASFTSLNGISLSNSAGTDPAIWFRNAAATADSKNWGMFANAAAFDFILYDDTGANGRAILKFSRVAGALTNLAFGNATNNPTYNFLGTGQTTIGGVLQVNGDHITLSNTDVYLQLIETDGLLDQKIWWERLTGGNFFLQTRADNLAAGSNALIITRTGTAVTQMLFGGGTDNTAYTFTGAGTATFGGPVVVTGDGTHYVAVQSLTSGDAVIKLDTIGVQNWAFGNRRSDGALVFSAATDLTNQRLVLTAPGQALFTDGTTNMPAISFMSDPDTGFYHPVAGQIRVIIDTTLHSVMSAASLQVQVPIWGMDGTAAAPGIAFANNANTGIYRAGTNFFAISTGGALRAGWDGTTSFYQRNQQWNQDGTAALPGYSFEADPNTGIYRSNPDSIAFSAGGILAGAFAIDGSGGAALYLPSGSGALPALSFLGDGDTGIYRLAADMFGFVTGGARRAYVYNGGFVVEVALRAVDGAAGSPSYTFDNDTDLGIYREGANILCISAGGSRAVRFAIDSGPTGRVTIASTGLASSVALSITQDAVANYFIINGAGGVTASSYDVSSARALKRETGKPSRVRDILAQLRPILYRLLVDEEREQIGLIAEEVHAVCPQLSDGKSVSYDRLAILLLAAWQDEHMAEAA